MLITFELEIIEKSRTMATKSCGVELTHMHSPQLVTMKLSCKHMFNQHNTHE